MGVHLHRLHSMASPMNSRVRGLTWCQTLLTCLLYVSRACH